MVASLNSTTCTSSVILFSIVNSTWVTSSSPGTSSCPCSTFASGLNSTMMPATSPSLPLSGIAVTSSLAMLLPYSLAA